MTARDEAIATMELYRADLLLDYVDLSGPLDAIPADVLARLAIEHGGLEPVPRGIQGGWDDGRLLYRVAEP